MILAQKLAVIGAWLIGSIGFLFPADTTFGMVGRALFILLAGIHTIECAVFYRTLRRTKWPPIWQRTSRTKPTGARS